MEFKEIIPPSGKWNKVEVKPSPGKGIGVFATKKIKQGEALCWYDGILCQVYDKNWNNIAPVFITGKGGYNQATKEFNNQYDVLAGTTKEFRKGGVASLINDFSTSNNGEEIYKNIINKNYNCDKQIKYDENGFKSYIVIAGRNIEKGEELYVPYGEMYWTDVDKKWTEEDIKKILDKINENYNQEHNSIDDYINRANIVKEIKDFWLD